MSAAQHHTVAPPDPEPEILTTLPRARDVRIEIKRVVYMGRERVDIRECLWDRSGVWRPTVKGAGIRIHELDAVIAALVSVRDREVAT